MGAAETDMASSKLSSTGEVSQNDGALIVPHL